MGYSTFLFVLPIDTVFCYSFLGRSIKWYRLEVREVHHQDLSAFSSAFLTNCRVGSQAIASIDDVTFEVDTRLNALLKECYKANPLEKI